MPKIDLAQFRFPQKSPIKLRKLPTKIKSLYADETDYLKQLTSVRNDINEMQAQMYAHDRHAMLVVFQAMDAAGKDSTITHVFSGVNPQGVEVHSFKAPSEEELNHDFLWRSTTKLPTRGKIGVFNRSYYEEVLICKVHPEIIQKYQRLPEVKTKDMKRLYQHRYESIADFEKHLARNGTHVVKFFLHVSKKEQAERFLARIEDPAKNWKFNGADLGEREHWEEYMDAYEECIKKTGTPDSPWYVIPADSKKNMRLIVASVLRHEMRKLHLEWPQFPEGERAAMTRSRKTLEAEVK
jgi:PPK2 family polyphosphate:nucleotide phosphotransferase